MEGQATSLAERVSRRLGSDGELATQQAAAAIRHQLNENAAPLWKNGHVPVADLWATYAQYPYMPRLRDRSVLDAGLLEQPMLWEQDGFALPEGNEEEAGRYRGLVLNPDEGSSIAITAETLIVRPDLAIAQQEAEGGGAGEVEGADPAGASAEAGPSTTPADGAGTGSTKGAGKTRFFGTKRLSGDRTARDFKEVSDEVIARLADVPGAEVRITLEIDATSPEGFDESAIRVVSENAKTLKFEQSDFEES